MILVNKDSKGKIRVVKINISFKEDTNSFVISRSTGVLDGKFIQQPDIVISKGKVNRTLKEQSELEYNSIINKYKDKGYKTYTGDLTESDINSFLPSNKEDANGNPKVMLAKQIKDINSKKIDNKKFYVSRKLDGVRCCLAYNGKTIYSFSRGGKHYDYALSHFINNKQLIEFFKANPNIILDGELYKHGKSLQEISGAARLQKNAYDCDWLEYYLYDVIDSNKKFKDRLDILNKIKSDLNLSYNPDRVWDDELQFQFVEHIEINNLKDAKAKHDEYVSEGFEGCILRDPDALYKCGGRDSSMIKIKEYLDECFKVIDYELGLRGIEDMVFILTTETGKKFKAKPTGNLDLKKDYVENFDTKYKNHIGELKYFTYSNDGIPLQPIFKCFRFDLE